MMALHKFSLKRFFTVACTFALFCAITWKSNANSTYVTNIYSTLTSDTVPPTKNKKPVPLKKVKTDSLINSIGDTSQTIDTIPGTTRDTTINNVDSFSIKTAKDTLDGPVNYEAEDSAVVLVPEKKIVLYGKTKTTFKDITLTAPKVQLDQQTNIITAYGATDSTGNKITRAKFAQNENEFEGDTFRFNFKTQKGLTINTFTKQSEFFVQGAVVKKVDIVTMYVKRGRFTTCNLDEPHFAFVSNRIKVINNKLAVSGPTHPEFEGVPIPIYLPFGFFPLSQGRHSGFLPPQFVVNEQLGLGLEGIGYYKVLNDNFDAIIRTNIYSYGSWQATFSPTYRKRYRYNGGVTLTMQHTKTAFVGDPDYAVFKTFNVSWNHSIDQRARPGVNFSANVNFGSTQFNRYVPNDPRRNFQNQVNSSISYSKTWIGKPYNLTLNANHSQNAQTRVVDLILPNGTFTVTTLYPFQKKESIGAPKWYEKLGIGYSGSFQNRISFYDSAVNIKRLLDTLQWGANHRLPITLSLPSLGPLNVSPFISYEEQWIANKFRRVWNDNEKKVDTVVTKGFYTDRQVSMGIGFNTSIYGTFNFKKQTGLIALRHTIRPQFSMNYRPDLSKNHYYMVQVDTSQRKETFSEFQMSGNVFQGYSAGRFGGMSFGIDNVLEGKVRSKKDTSSDAKPKIIHLIDGLSINSGYNFLDTSYYKLQDFLVSLRSTLFEKINITGTAQLSPYAADSVGNRIRRFIWNNGHFSPGRFLGGSISMSTQFSSKPKDPNKLPQFRNNAQNITDPTVLGDQQRLMDYMRRNPGEFVDFNVNWQLSLSYALYFQKELKPDYSGLKNTVHSSGSFQGSFNLTPKWNVSANGYFNFESPNFLDQFSLSISRDMHCWQMSIGVTPIGPYRYFNITINPKASILQDLRINRTRSFQNF